MGPGPRTSAALGSRHLARNAARRVRRPSGEVCLVCGSPRSPYERIVYEPKPTLARRFSRCSGCGYLQIEELSSDRYRGQTSLDHLPNVGGDRLGTETAPGREFKMARMAVHALDRSQVDVMIYGIGRSLDNLHIQRLSGVETVAIGDIVHLRDDAEFHDVNEKARRRFAVVVASEVVEHFRSPAGGLREAVRVRGARRSAGLCHEHLPGRRPQPGPVPVLAGPHVVLHRSRHWSRSPVGGASRWTSGRQGSPGRSAANASRSSAGRRR